MENFWYGFIKRYYQAGLYVCNPKHDMFVKKFCEHGKITQEQYKEITGKEYLAE